MNRRTFCKLSALAALAPTVGLPALSAPPPPPRDKFEVMSPEEIKRHWHLAETPIFRCKRGYLWTARVYRSKFVVDEDAFMLGDWRSKVTPPVIAEINRHADYWRYVHRGAVHVETYVLNVRLCETPLVYTRAYPVMYRLAHVRYPYIHV
jgi:hypothetical protein